MNEMATGNMTAENAADGGNTAAAVDRVSQLNRWRLILGGGASKQLSFSEGAALENGISCMDLRQPNLPASDLLRQILLLNPVVRKAVW